MRDSCRLLIVVMFLSIAIPVAAQEVVVTSKAKEIYLGTNGAIFYDRPVSQSDIAISWESGVFVDVWASTAANTELEFDKEIDFILGYGSTVGRFKYAVDTEYFVVKGIDIASVNGELGFGSSFIRLEAYSPVQRGGPRRGLISSVGVRDNISLSPKWIVYLQEWFKHDTGSFGFDDAFLIQGHFWVNYSVLEKTSLIIGTRWSAPLTEVSDGRKKELVWEFGLNHRF